MMTQVRFAPAGFMNDVRLMVAGLTANGRTCSRAAGARDRQRRRQRQQLLTSPPPLGHAEPRRRACPASRRLAFRLAARPVPMAFSGPPRSVGCSARRVGARHEDEPSMCISAREIALLGSRRTGESPRAGPRRQAPTFATDRRRTGHKATAGTRGLYRSFIQGPTTLSGQAPRRCIDRLDRPESTGQQRA